MLGTPGKHHGAASRLLRKGEASAGLEGKHSTRQEIFGARTDAAFCAHEVQWVEACHCHLQGVTEAGDCEALGKVGALGARVLGGARLATPSAQHYRLKLRLVSHAIQTKHARQRSNDLVRLYVR